MIDVFVEAERRKDMLKDQVKRRYEFKIALEQWVKEGIRQEKLAYCTISYGRFVRDESDCRLALEWVTIKTWNKLHPNDIKHSEDKYIAKIGISDYFPEDRYKINMLSEHAVTREELREADFYNNVVVKWLVHDLEMEYGIDTEASYIINSKKLGRYEVEDKVNYLMRYFKNVVMKNLDGKLCGGGDCLRIAYGIALMWKKTRNNKIAVTFRIVDLNKRCKDWEILKKYVVGNDEEMRKSYKDGLLFVRKLVDNNILYGSE